MKTEFSKTWNRSKQPRKQRKYRAKAPLHRKGKFLSAHLSKELKDKYGTRSLRIRKGDKVKVVRGDFKGKTGTIDVVDTKNERIYISDIEVNRRDGSKAHPPLRPSNLIITEVNRDDQKRMAKLGEKPVLKKEAKKEVKKDTSKAEVKEEKPKASAEKKAEKKAAPKKSAPKKSQSAKSKGGKK